jgi:uncharacterized protein YdiU (UPF0061 family)
MRTKLGLQRERPEDLSLVEKLLMTMQTEGADFTLTFRRLCAAADDASAHAEVRSLFQEPEAYDLWAGDWEERLSHESASRRERAVLMRTANPALIPRNHRVAQALEAGARGDFSVFERLRTALERPYEDCAEYGDLMLPPEPHERVLRTFCGT